MQIEENTPKRKQSGHAILPGLAFAALLALAVISPGWISTSSAADAPAPAPGADTAASAKPADTSAAAGKAPDTAPETLASIKQPNFSLQYPSSWKIDTTARNYDANTNFTLISPKNSYIQFTILGLADDAQKIVNETVKKLDGPTITSLSKTKLDEWGPHKGVGYHLKGKILGSFPGGIKVFVFTTSRHNVLVVENYFSDELKDVLGDFDTISKNFQMTKGE